jgi:hypothetical protein
LPDLPLNLFLRLGGHVKLTNHKSFISPLPAYVETKAGDAETGLARRNQAFSSYVSITFWALILERTAADIQSANAIPDLICGDVDQPQDRERSKILRVCGYF